MSQNRPKFIKGSESEKRLRIMICIIGTLLFLCSAIAIADFFSSLDDIDALLMKSAFITEDIRELPDSYISEKEAAR